MEKSEVAVGFAVLGILFLSVTMLFTPTTNKEYTTQLIDSGNVPEGANVTEYTELSVESKEGVDQAIQNGYSTMSVSEDSRVLTEMRGEQFIRKNGTVYFMKTSSADDGGFFAEQVRLLGLVIGCLLIWSSIYLFAGVDNE